MRRAVAAVAAASLVGAAGAEAQEAPVEPAPTTTAVETTPAPAPAPQPTESAPAPAPPAPPAPAPAAPAPPAPSAVPSVAATGTQPEEAAAAKPPRRAAARRADRAEERREARARERARAAKRRAERKAEATARRLAREESATGEEGGDELLRESALLPGLAIGRPIPSFLIERFRIPPFLLSIYQAAGAEYGIRWEVLAAINEIETDYGRNLNVSSAGAQGWMQFMPATWRAYGTDANDDGRRDPYNPVDAIFAAARYLKAAGYERDVRGAIFAYNHADWYVNSVLARAKLISLLPTELVGSLTGLTEGRFPVAAEASYATRATPAALAKKGKRRTVTSEGSELRRELDVLADAGSPVIAVQDGRITRIGNSPVLGRFVQLRDVYGNTYTYGNLGTVAKTYLTPKAGAKPEPEPEREAPPAADVPSGLAGIPDGLPLRAGAARGPRDAADEPGLVDPDGTQRRILTRPGHAPSAAELRAEAPAVSTGPRDSELRGNLEAARAAGMAPAATPETGRRVAVAPRPEVAEKAAKEVVPASAAARRMLEAQTAALRSAVVVPPPAADPPPVVTPAEGPARLVPVSGPWKHTVVPAWPVVRRTGATPAPAAAPAPEKEPTLARMAREVLPPVEAPADAAPAVPPTDVMALVPAAPTAAEMAPAPTSSDAKPASGAALVPAPAVVPERGDRTVYSPYQRRLLGGLKRKDVRKRKLRVGSTVVGGTVLGRLGKAKEPRLRFRIRPAGDGTPLIDPTPILDGWRLLDSTAVYRGTGRSALRPEGASVGRILLESKERLVRRVLADDDIELHACGRVDVATGRIDRRVLATLAVLSEEGLKPTVSSLRCGREGRLTASGNVSQHTTGTAVDISAINGTPILGNQGPGSVTEQAVRKLLTLQGTMKPHQIITLLQVPGADNTIAMADHADHIHIGWEPRAGRGSGATLGGGLRGSDWDRLMARLNVIDNPMVAATPSPGALPVAPAKQKGR